MSAFLEGEPIVATAAVPTSLTCHFSQKIYNVDMLENQSGRHRLTKVSSNCEEQHLPYSYLIAQATGLFLRMKRILQMNSTWTRRRARSG